jgi:hypothetical protein
MHKLLKTFYFIINCRIFCCLEQGQSYLPDQQTILEDRYYNNQSFQVGFCLLLNNQLFHPII